MSASVDDSKQAYCPDFHGRGSCRGDAAPERIKSTAPSSIMTRRLFKRLQLSVSRKSRRQAKTLSPILSSSSETMLSNSNDFANGNRRPSLGRVQGRWPPTMTITGKVVKGSRKHLQNLDVWKEAPILKGTTSFEPLPDVRNIMVTGGAGFM